MLPLRKALPATLLLGFALLAPPGSAARAGDPASCVEPGPGWCRARRITGDVAQGELGFRFGEPLDADGDGRADVAGGTRFETASGTLQNGSAAVWSGATGAPIRAWRGDLPDALFGHWILLVPDLGDDGLADVVIAAPTARVDGEVRGLLVARSPATGAELWRHTGEQPQSFGWDLAPAGDHDGDGRSELFVGAPAPERGRVHLVASRDGTVLRSYAIGENAPSFGWAVARSDDLDGDGRADLIAGVPLELDGDGAQIGGAWALSSTTGAVLRHWQGPDPLSGFGEVVAGLGDLDGDGRGDVAVGAPRSTDRSRTRPGDVWVYSGASGGVLAHWSGTQPGELFGRMVIGAGDLDGDRVEDLAIGAPWHRRGEAERVGRLELRSGRTGEVLGEIFGDGAESWLGWHVRRAPDPAGLGRPALLVGSLRQPVEGRPGAGVLDVYVLRSGPTTTPGAQGTMTRDARRKDIR